MNETSFTSRAPSERINPSPKRHILTLILTRRCNLNCAYCYERYKSNGVMSFETASRQIEEAFQRVVDSADLEELEINFFGGEPFLEFDLMKRISEWVWSEPRSAPYVISASTNGTLIDDKIKGWMMEHKRSFIPILSYDGSSCHDANRSNSLNSIDLKFFRDVYPQQKFKMTVSPDAVDRLADDVADAFENGFHIEMSYAHGVDWTDEKLETYQRQLFQLAQYFLDNPTVPLVLPFSRSLRAALNKGEPQKFCGCGEMYVIDVDGTRYPCQLCTPLVLEADKIKRLQEIKDFKKKEVFFDSRCEGCSYRHVCKTCYGHNILERGSLSRKPAKYCRLNQAEVRACMKYKAALYKSKIDAGVQLTPEEIFESKAILHLAANPPKTLDDSDT